MDISSPKPIGQDETSLKYAQIVKALDQATDSDIKSRPFSVEKPGSDKDSKVIRGKKRGIDVLKNEKADALYDFQDEMADKMADVRYLLNAMVDKMMDVDKRQVLRELANVKEDLIQKDRNGQDYAFSSSYSYMQDGNMISYVQTEVLVKASEEVKEGMQRVKFNLYTNIVTETVLRTRASEKEDRSGRSNQYLRMHFRETREIRLEFSTFQEMEEEARSLRVFLVIMNSLFVLIQTTLQQPTSSPQNTETSGLPPHKQQVDQEPLHREDHSPSADLANLSTLQESFVPAIQCSEQPPTKREYLYMSSPMPTKSSEDTWPMTQLQMSEATGSLPDYSAIAEDSYTIPESEEGSDDASSKLIVCASQLRRTEIESPKLCSLPEPVQIQDKVSEVLHDTTTVEAPSTASSTDVSNNGQESNNQHDKSCNEPSLQPQSPSENDLQSNLQVVDTDTTTYKPEKTNRAKKTPQSLTSDYNLAHECTVTHRDLATLSKDQVSIAKAGAIPHPVKLPELECDDVQLFSTACLAYNSPDSQLAIFKASDLTLQVSLLGLPVSYTHVESTLQAIRKGNLRDLYVLFQGVVPPLMACWTTHCKDVLVYSKLTEMEDMEDQVSIAKAGAIPHLVKLLESECDDVQLFSAACLGILVYDNPNNKSAIFKASVGDTACNPSSKEGHPEQPSPVQRKASAEDHPNGHIIQASKGKKVSASSNSSSTSDSDSSSSSEGAGSGDSSHEEGGGGCGASGRGDDDDEDKRLPERGPNSSDKKEHSNKKKKKKKVNNKPEELLLPNSPNQEQTSQASASSNPDYHCQNTKGAVRKPVQAKKKFHLSLSRKQENSPSKLQQVPDMPIPASVTCLAPPISTVQGSPQMKLSEESNPSGVGRSSIVGLRSSLSSPNANQKSLIPTEEENRMQAIPGTGIGTVGSCSGSTQPPVQPPEGTSKVPSPVVQCTPGRHQGLPELTENTPIHAEGTAQVPPSPVDRKAPGRQAGVMPELTEDVPTHAEAVPPSPVDRKAPGRQAGVMPELTEDVPTHAEAVPPSPVDRKAPGRQAGVMPELTEDVPTHAEAVPPSPVDWKAPGRQAGVMPELTENVPTHAEAVPPSPVDRKAPGRQAGVMPELTEDVPTHAEAVSPSPVDRKAPGRQAGVMPEDVPTHAEAVPPSPVDRKAPGRQAGVMPELTEDVPTHAEAVPSSPVDRKAPGRQAGVMPELTENVPTHAEAVPPSPVDRKAPGRQAGVMPELTEDVPTHAEAVPPSPVDWKAPGRQAGVMPELTEDVPTHAEAVPPSPVDRKAPGRQAGVMPELTEDVPTHAEAVSPSPVDRKAPGRQAGVMPEDVPTHAEAVPPSPVDRKAPGRQAGVMPELTEDVPTHAEAVPPSPVDRKAPGRQAGVMPELTENVPTHAEAVPPSPVDWKAPGRQAGVMPELTEDVPTHAEAVPPSPVDRKAPGRQAGVMPELTEDVPTHAEAVPPSPVDRKAPGRQAGVMPELTENVPTHAEAVMPELTEDVPTHAEAVPPSPVDRKAPGRQAGVMPELTENVPTHAEAVPPSSVDRKAPGRQAGVMPELTEDVPTHAEAVPPSPVDRKAPGRQAGAMPELMEDVPTHAEAVPPSPVGRKAPGRQAGAMPELTENIPTHAEGTAQTPLSPLDQQVSGSEDYEHSSEVHYDDELNSVQEESYGVEPHEVLLGSGGNDSVLDFAVSHAHEPQSNTGSETLPEYDIAENTLSGYSYSEELQGVLQETPDEAHTGIESEHEPHPPTAFNIQHSPGLPPVIEPFISSCGNCYTNNDDTAHFQIPQQEGNHTACPSPPGPSSQQVLHCHQTDGHHDATPPSNQSANTCGHTAHNVMCVGGELFTSPEASSIDSQHFGPQPFPNLWEPHGNVPVPSPLCGEEEEEVCHDVINKPPTIIAERTH